MALSHEEIGNILDEKGPDLLERIEPNELFFSVLVKWKVVSQSWRQNLEGKSRHEKIVAVLDVVHAGTWEQFKGLIIALRKTNQEAVVSILRHEAAPATAKKTRQTSAVECVHSNCPAASHFQFPEGASSHPVSTLTTHLGSMSLLVTPKRLE